MVKEQADFTSIAIEKRIREKDPEMTNKYQELALNVINSLKEAKDVETAKAILLTLTTSP